MLAQDWLGQQLGLREVLVTRAVDNLGSWRVIEADGGALARDRRRGGPLLAPTSQRDT
jgi:predicted acetyltransferase